MGDRINILLEGEKRGILNEDQAALLQEARRRGMAEPQRREDDIARNASKRAYEGKHYSTDTYFPRPLRDIGNTVRQYWNYATGDEEDIKAINQEIIDNNIADDAYDRTAQPDDRYLLINNGERATNGKINQYGYPEATTPNYYGRVAKNILGDAVTEVGASLLPIGAVSKTAKGVKYIKKAKDWLDKPVKNLVPRHGKYLGLSVAGAGQSEVLSPTEVRNDESLLANKGNNAVQGGIEGYGLGLGVGGVIRGGGLIKDAFSKPTIKTQDYHEPISKAEKEILDQVYYDIDEINNRLPEAKRRVEMARVRGIPLGVGDAVGGQLGAISGAYASSGRQYARDFVENFDDKVIKSQERMINSVNRDAPQVDNIVAGSMLQDTNKKRQDDLLKDTQEEAEEYYERAKQNKYAEDNTQEIDDITQNDLNNIGGYTPEQLVAMREGKPKTFKPRKPYQRNVIQNIINSGGIHPRSDMARNLYAVGINNKTAPALFNNRGRKAWDNIPFEEYGYDYENLVNDNGYLDENSLFQRIWDETYPDVRKNFKDNFQRSDNRKVVDDMRISGDKKLSYDQIMSLGLDPYTASKDDIEQALRELSQAQNQPSNNPDYLDAISKQGDEFEEIEQPEFKRFKDVVEYKTIDDTALSKSDTWNKYIGSVQKDRPDTFRENGDIGKTVGNALSIRNKLQRDIDDQKSKPAPDNGLIREWQNVVNLINVELKKVPDIVEGDNIYQKYYGTKKEQNKNLVGSFANATASQVGNLLNRAMEMPSYKQFKEVLSGQTQQNRQALGQQYLRSVFDKIKAEDKAYADFYTRHFGSNLQKQKLKFLLGAEYDRVHDFYSTLKEIKGRKFLSGGSNTANKLKADEERNQRSAMIGLSADVAKGNYYSAMARGLGTIWNKSSKSGKELNRLEREKFDFLNSGDKERIKRTFELLELQKKSKEYSKKNKQNSRKNLSRSSPLMGMVGNDLENNSTTIDTINREEANKDDETRKRKLSNALLKQRMQRGEF